MPTDRMSVRQNTGIMTDRQTYRETNTHADGQNVSQIEYSHNDRQTDRHTEGQTHMQTDRMSVR